ncbi:MAG: hypothetical protein KC933_17255 [Myxococcales bacterium]|nr:hypothetical protein [Myxococcales bacterium]
MACGDADAPEAVDVSAHFASLAPAGAAATIVSATFPTTLAPGERGAARVTVQNSGSVTWTANQFALHPYPTADSASWAIRMLRSDVAPGGSATFDLAFTAPDVGSTTRLFGRMVSLLPGQDGPFGASLDVTATIDAGVTRQLACAAVSNTVPTAVAPGASVPVTITVRNAGTATWPGGQQLCLYERDGGTWGGSARCVQLDADVAAGATHTFSMTLQAPATPGTYALTRQMFDGRALAPPATGVGFFDQDDPCVDLSVSVVGGTPTPWAASFTGATFPATGAPGETIEIPVSIRNDGTVDWPGDGSVVLQFVGNPSTPAARVSAPVRQPVLAGGSVVVTLRTQLPTTPGAVAFAFRMLAPAVGLFGDMLTGSTNVDAAATAAFDASLVSETLPGMMAPSAPQLATVTMQNDGTSTWAADGSVMLHSLNSPTSLFQVSQRLVTTPVPPGGQYTFTIPLRAPATPGTYAHRWRMFSSTATYFGPTIDVPVVVSGAVTPGYDGALVQQLVPTQLPAGDQTTFTIEYRNTGSQAWAPGDVVLLSANSPYGLWGGTVAGPTQGTTIPPGASATFQVRVVAPAVAGTYASAWRLFATDGTGYFGPTAVSTVDVNLSGAADAGVPDSGVAPTVRITLLGEWSWVDWSASAPPFSSGYKTCTGTCCALDVPPGAMVEARARMPTACEYPWLNTDYSGPWACQYDFGTNTARCTGWPTQDVVAWVDHAPSASCAPSSCGPRTCGFASTALNCGTCASGDVCIGSCVDPATCSP